MKDFFKAPILPVFLFFGLCAHAAGYCPSYNELQDKMNYYSKKVYSNLYDANPDFEKSMNLYNEEIAYFNGLFPDCLQYFKNIENPDCSRATVLSVGYGMILDQDKQNAAKLQFKNLLDSLNGKCENEFSFARQNLDN